MSCVPLLPVPTKNLSVWLFQIVAGFGKQAGVCSYAIHKIISISRDPLPKVMATKPASPQNNELLGKFCLSSIFITVLRVIYAKGKTLIPRTVKELICHSHRRIRSFARISRQKDSSTGRLSTCSQFEPTYYQPEW